MLDKTETIQEKISVEKMILDIENKISNIRVKMVYSFETVRRKVTEELNDYYKEKGDEKRVMSISDLLSVSTKTQERIMEIITEDRKF